MADDVNVRIALAVARRHLREQEDEVRHAREELERVAAEARRVAEARDDLAAAAVIEGIGAEPPPPDEWVDAAYHGGPYGDGWWERDLDHQLQIIAGTATDVYPFDPEAWARDRERSVAADRAYDRWVEADRFGDDPDELERAAAALRHHEEDDEPPATPRRCRACLGNHKLREIRFVGDTYLDPDGTPHRHQGTEVW